METDTPEAQETPRLTEKKEPTTLELITKAKELFLEIPPDFILGQDARVLINFKENDPTNSVSLTILKEHSKMNTKWDLTRITLFSNAETGEEGGSLEKGKFNPLNGNEDIDKDPSQNGRSELEKQNHLKQKFSGILRSIKDKLTSSDQVAPEDTESDPVSSPEFNVKNTISELLVLARKLIKKIPDVKQSDYDADGQGERNLSGDFYIAGKEASVDLDVILDDKGQPLPGTENFSLAVPFGRGPTGRIEIEILQIPALGINYRRIENTQGKNGSFLKKEPTTPSKENNNYQEHITDENMLDKGPDAGVAKIKTVLNGLNTMFSDR